MYVCAYKFMRWIIYIELELVLHGLGTYKLPLICLPVVTVRNNALGTSNETNDLLMRPYTHVQYAQRCKERESLEIEKLPNLIQTYI